MPSETQFVELGRLARDGKCWFEVHRARNGVALGQAIDLGQAMLSPWAEAYVRERLNKDAWEAEDLTHQAGAQIIARIDSLEVTTGKDFYNLMKKIVRDLVHDQERQRFARRGKARCEPLSLERDAEAMRQAELLIDDQPTGEDLALLRENKGDVRRVLKRLTREERQVVRMIMQGIALARIIELYGVRMRAAWRRARARLRNGLRPE